MTLVVALRFLSNQEETFIFEHWRLTSNSLSFSSKGPSSAFLATSASMRLRTKPLALVQLQIQLVHLPQLL